VTESHDFLANVVGAAALAVTERIDAATRAACGASGAVPAALVALHEFAGGQTIDYLRNVVGLTPSGTVRLVDRLEREGLARRGAGADGRSISVHLTEDGGRVARRVRDARTAVLASLLDDLTAAQRGALADAAGALLAAVTDGRDAARHTCRLCDVEACGHHRGTCPVTNAADAVAAAGSGA
jgi:DNA-binding MarR family transcriptional regulator